jgi:Family of unknown function (DUF5872)
MSPSGAIPADQKTYDKIVAKVKARVDRWPSAYASGQVVQEYKAAMEKKGLAPYLDKKPDSKKGIARWFNENWIDIKTGKPCGSVKTADYYPTCRPAKRVTAKSPVTAKELTPAQKQAMVEQKQKAKTHIVEYKETKTVRHHNK